MEDVEMKSRTLLLTVLVATALAAACADSALAPPADDGTPSAPTIDAGIAAVLAGSGSPDAVEVIVTYSPLLTTGDALAGAILDAGAGVLGFRHLPMLAALATPAQLAVVRALPGVSGLFLAAIEQPLNREAVTSVRADEVYALKAGTRFIDGAGIGVAILDTGVDATHPDLQLGSKTVQNVHAAGSSKDVYHFKGRDPVTGSKTPKELKKGADLWLEDVPNTDISASGHGTHVAATVAGSGAASGGALHGVAPGAHIIGVNAATAAGFPEVLILAGFDYILENRRDYNIQVVNNSWGSSGAYNPDEPIPQATKVLHDAGITVVFAAGNDGPAQNTMNRRSVAPWVISVAASCKLGGDPIWMNGYCRDDVVGPLRFRADDGRDGILTYFSSRGVPGDPIQHPDVLAPGARIVSARAAQGADMVAHEAGFINIGTCPALEDQARYACVSGTSMAAPVVTGVIALMEQATGGRITPAQTLQVLMDTARPLAGYEFWEVGAGHVDARAAVEAALRLYR
jgi:serine protease AprX